MYAPYLAWAIHQHNEEVAMGNTNQTLKINLKGFIVANGATDWDTDPFISTVDTAYHFNIVNPQIYKRYKALGCRYYWQEIKPRLPDGCLELLKTFEYTFNYTDLYDLRRAKDVELTNQARSLSESRESCHT